MSVSPKPLPSLIRAAIYTRISSDPSGRRAGVERQRVDCEAYCRARGWAIEEVFCDNDVTAYGKKPRPAYDRMLAAVESGRVEAIVSWHNDRLHRSPTELEAFIDLVERSHVRLAVVTGGDYDLTTPDGRLSARIVGAVARKESEDRSRRVRRKHLELAEEGRPAGQLGWGVRSDDERELVREAAARVLAGQGLITVVRDWDRRGIPSPSGRRWEAPTLRRAMLSARMAGLREHGVDPSGRTLGQLTPAVWEGALDRRTWDQLRAVLLNPARNTTVPTATRRLLTGLIFCGGCGAAMMSRPRDDHTKRYVCAGRHQGHQLAIVAQPTDDVVAERVLDLLGDQTVRAALLGDSGRSAEDPELAQALSELGSTQSRLHSLDDDYYVLGRLAEARYRCLRAKLERRVERLQRAIDAATRQRIVILPDPRANWAEADIAQRRELVRLLVERVTILPARRGLPRFDPGRIRMGLSVPAPAPFTVITSPGQRRPAKGAKAARRQRTSATHSLVAARPMMT